MKERPILFSGEMVRAIMSGRKTQTRRIMRTQPPSGTIRMYAEESADFLTKTDRWNAEYVNMGRQWTNGALYRCPYGQPGDRLWVRETWATSLCCDDRPPRETNNHGLPFWYNADGTVRYTGANEGGPGFTTRGKWRPSINMPRWASRITLEVAGVRVQRLNMITDIDAMHEGAEQVGDCDGALVDGYRQLWERINGTGSWSANPWVWVIEFRKLEATA